MVGKLGAVLWVTQGSRYVVAEEDYDADQHTLIHTHSLKQKHM